MITNGNNSDDTDVSHIRKVQMTCTRKQLIHKICKKWYDDDDDKKKQYYIAPTQAYNKQSFVYNEYK